MAKFFVDEVINFKELFYQYREKVYENQSHVKPDNNLQKVFKLFEDEMTNIKNFIESFDIAPFKMSKSTKDVSLIKMNV